MPRLNWAQFRDPVVFGIIGCISAACYVALGVLFSRLPGVRPSMALAGALIVMLLPNYAAQRTLTFRSRRNHRQALPRYLVTQAISNLLGMVLSELFADQVFYVAGNDPNAIAPFMLKSEADAFATKTGGKVMTFEQALKATVSGG